MFWWSPDVLTSFTEWQLKHPHLQIINLPGCRYVLCVDWTWWAQNTHTVLVVTLPLQLKVLKFGVLSVQFHVCRELQQSTFTFWAVPTVVLKIFFHSFIVLGFGLQYAGNFFLLSVHRILFLATPVLLHTSLDFACSAPLNLADLFCFGLQCDLHDLEFSLFLKHFAVPFFPHFQGQNLKWATSK